LSYNNQSYKLVAAKGLISLMEQYTDPDELNKNDKLKDSEEDNEE
jgi:hypothetical protein